MIHIEAVAEQVFRNCCISDARSAGLYSVCGLALRLRDLFKWEKGLPPWEERDSAEILDWIGEKEALWDRIAERRFSRLRLNGRRYDPFDTAGVNRILVPEGFYYGAGYAHSMKPTFFLAHIESRRKIDGVRVCILGRELARDLLTLPAMSQDEEVLIRCEAARLFLWDQMLYVQKSGRISLAWALKAAGLSDPKPETIRSHMDEVFAAARDLYVYHEIGELKNRTFDRERWRRIVAGFAHTPVELLARSLKDLLADTDPGGTLPRLIEERQVPAIGFYAAFIDGMARALFPQVRPAFVNFAKDGDWQALDRVVQAENTDMRRLTGRFLAIFEEGEQRGDPKWTQEEVGRRILKPLEEKRREDR